MLWDTVGCLASLSKIEGGWGIGQSKAPAVVVHDAYRSGVSESWVPRKISGKILSGPVDLQGEVIRGDGLLSATDPTTLYRPESQADHASVRSSPVLRSSSGH